MRKTIRLKVVPDGKPNDAGEWVTVQVDATKVPLDPAMRSFRCLADALALHVPPGHHLVAVEQ